jgi:murein DD-endopeptidase MepM/ murein hydrolase activator NlpD
MPVEPTVEPPSEPIAAPPPAVRYRSTPERVIAGGRVVAAKGMYRDYTVQPKDHVDAIARDLQTTRKVLVEANHLKAPYALQPGQHLKVPVAKAYEVQSGDTMAEVAKRFGVGVGELSDLNDLSARARLRPGDSLALPDGFHDHGPTRVPGTIVAERASEPYRAAPPPTRRQPPPPSEEATGGPYVPSPEALAAAQRLAVTRSYGPPSYSPARPNPNPPPSPAAEAPQGPPTAAQLSVANAGRGRFIWPLRGDIISPFGVKGVGRRNDGIDVRSPQGAVVRAAAAGEVVYAGDQVPGFGNLVLVKHADGWVTAYAHLMSIDVQMRQSVTQGQSLGEVGSTGGVSEPQLHFEMRYAPTPAEKAKPVDPLLVLPK